MFHSFETTLRKFQKFKKMAKIKIVVILNIVSVVTKVLGPNPVMFVKMVSSDEKLKIHLLTAVQIKAIPVGSWTIKHEASLFAWLTSLGHQGTQTNVALAQPHLHTRFPG